MLWQVKLAALLITLAALFGGYKWVGYSAVEEYKKEAAVEQAKADKKQQAKYDKLEAEYDELKDKRQEDAKVIYKTVEKIITRDVYRNICIDDDGLHIANQALSGNIDSGAPVKKVPPIK